jgi:general secretion pathway protein D
MVLCSVFIGLLFWTAPDTARGVRVSEEEVVGQPAGKPTPAPVVPTRTMTPPAPAGTPLPVEVRLPQAPSTEEQDKAQQGPPGLPQRKVTPLVPSPKPPVSRPPEPAAETKPVLAAAGTSEKDKAPEKRSVTIDFDNVDVLLFVKFISEVTGKNFIIDEKVKGKVTIISPTKISVDEAYRVFESVLEVHGFTTIESENVVKIVPSVDARGKSIETRLKEEASNPEDRIITQLIPLRYANPDELKKLFAPLISKSSVIVSYPPSGMLIVTDVLSNIERLMRIISAVDVVGVGEEISVIPLEHAAAETLIKPLTTIFQTGTAAAKKGAAAAVQPTIKIVADERTNSLILSASEYDTERIKQLIKILDQEMPRGTGNVQVLYLQYADAEELAKVLTALPSKDAKADEKGKAPVISKEVQIVADKATNSLVITTNKQDFMALSEVIKKLDIPRSMVYIEALIMEVNTDKEFRLGVEWRVGDDNVGSYEGRTVGAIAGSLPGTSSIPTTANLPTGLFLGVLGESITIGGVSFPSVAAVARAFQSDSDVHILQTPQLLTTDNEEAEIQVASNVPYLTKEASGDQSYQTYEYRDVGLKLKITPQINQEGFVRLKVFQEYSTLSEGSEADRPTTLKRTADTTVLVRNKETVVIGGLVGDQIDRGTSGVPCLGDIPLVGWFFKSYTRTQKKTNLFIFLTPHVIEGPAEAKKIFDEKKEGMDRIEEGVIKMYQNIQPPVQPDAE